MVAALSLYAIYPFFSVFTVGPPALSPFLPFILIKEVNRLGATCCENNRVH